MLEIFYFLRKMTPRFKSLTKKEICKIITEIDGENFADSDSDYEINNTEKTINEYFDENENDLIKLYINTNMK